MNDIENKIDQISDEALDQVAGGLNLGPMPGDGIKKKSDLDPTQKTYTDEELAALAARSQAIGKIGGGTLTSEYKYGGVGGALGSAARGQMGLG